MHGPYVHALMGVFYDRVGSTKAFWVSQYRENVGDHPDVKGESG